MPFIKLNRCQYCGTTENIIERDTFPPKVFGYYCWPCYNKVAMQADIDHDNRDDKEYWDGVNEEEEKRWLKDHPDFRYPRR